MDGSVGAQRPRAFAASGYWPCLPRIDSSLHEFFEALIGGFPMTPYKVSEPSACPACEFCELSGYLCEFIVASPSYEDGAEVFYDFSETPKLPACLPLNSPTYYPPYNGAIGRGQGEIKEALREKLKYRPACPTEHVEAWAATAANDRNHQERHRLKGRNSCQTFFTDKDRARHHRRLRKEIYDALIEKQTIIVAAMEERNKRDKEAAWRIAVEQWLVKNQHITITQNQQLSPHLPVNLSHN